jgi:hypothetical protein
MMFKDKEVQLQFSPKLSDESIREEVLRLSISKSMEEEKERARLDSACEGVQKKGGKRRLTTTASPLLSSFSSLGSQNQLADGSESKRQINKVPPPQKG